MKKRIAVAILVLLLVQFTVPQASAQRRPMRPPLRDFSPEQLELLEARIETYVRWKTLISALNIGLMLYIAVFYYQLYRENGSKFSLGLTALSLALLVYSVSSNPVLISYLRPSNGVWWGVFNFVPDVFTSVAAFIMVYLSRT